MDNEIKSRMIELLKNRGAYHSSVNHVQHYTRCPYCGDSRNMSHAHLSIRIDVSDDYPMLFRCLKCGVSGVVSSHVLDELGLYVDPSFKKDLGMYNRKGAKHMGLTNMDKENYAVPLYQDNPKNRSKLEYVNRRIGTSLTYPDAREYKMVLSLYDFMKLNDIPYIEEVSPQMMDILDTYYVGWLSANNNNIIFRDITNSLKYRYYKIKLNQKNMNGDSFFAIPSSIPLMYTHDVHIHVAEGTFDILSIREHVVNKGGHNLYYAACGFGGAVILHYLIHHGINTGLHLHLYSDADKRDWDHENYLSQSFGIAEWFDKIYIHRNQFDGEKDYGVTADHIIDSFRCIK